TRFSRDWSSDVCSSDLRYMNGESSLNLPVAPTLLMDFHGPTAQSLKTAVELVQSICQESGATRFEAGVGREARDRLWHGRHRLEIGRASCRGQWRVRWG